MACACAWLGVRPCPWAELEPECSLSAGSERAPGTICGMLSNNGGDESIASDEVECLRFLRMVSGHKNIETSRPVKAIAKEMANATSGVLPVPFKFVAAPAVVVSVINSSSNRVGWRE